MAKRKRLTPAQGLELGATPPSESFARETLQTKSALPPIAALAGDISREAALTEVSASMGAARAEGRLAEPLPLSSIVEDHLIRDRVAVDPSEMETLVESLRNRGQQVPVEVMDLGQGRYGLISGWRRVQALRRLAEEGRGDTVLAVLRHPDGAAGAYLAMVEENEIRANLGFWERGRIVVRAVEAGVFETHKQALIGLFGSILRAKRSKIGSFALLVQHLDGVLRFPAALSERQGLALVRPFKETGSDQGKTALAKRLADHLDTVDPATPEAEAEVLAAFLKSEADSGHEPLQERVTPKNPETETTTAIHFSVGSEVPARSVTLSGPGVTAAFRARLKDWIEANEP